MGSADATMLKVLTFESARMQRTDAAFMQHDCSAHFDRIYPENTSVFATKYGVDKNILTSVAKTVESMERHVETGLGISERYYGNGAGKPRLNGMVQGKADVPQLATQGGAERAKNVSPAHSPRAGPYGRSQARPLTQSVKPAVQSAMS